MVSKRSVTHRVIASRGSAVRVGQNVAYAGSAGAVLQAWCDSPSHRENLLDSRYRYAGLAIACERRPVRCYGVLMLMR